MDTITHEGYSPNTDRDLTSPFPPKRPRPDCRHNNGGKNSLAFPELVTFWKSIGSPSSTSIWQETAGLVCVAESGDMEDEKTPEQLQDARFIVNPITGLTTSHTGSSDVSLNSVERRFKLLVRDEQPPIAPTDKLSSNGLEDQDRAIAENCTLIGGSADTPSHPDSKLRGKALEDEAQGNNKAGALVQNRASQIRGLQVSSRDQSGCISENSLRDTWGQSSVAGESNQECQEPGFRETILLSDEKEEDNSLISFSNADTYSFFSNPQPSANLAQICECVAICYPKTKDQVNENAMSINSIPSAALCAEGSIVSYGVVSVRNIAIERVSLDADDFCGAKGEWAAGKMIAQANSKTSDHTTGTPVPAQIHQGPAEGDNDVSPFTIIEPAIWSETGGEVKEKGCNSGSAAAGVQLLLSVKACNLETPLPLCSDVRLSQEVLTLSQNGKSDYQSLTQQRKDGKEVLWQSFTEPQACSINTYGTHNYSGSDGSCHWKTSPSSRPAKPPPAGKEPDQSGCFHFSPDQMKTKEVEYSQAEISRTDEATEIKESRPLTGFEEEIMTGEQQENIQDLEQKRLQQNKKHAEEATETSTGNSIRDQAEGKTSIYEDKLTHVDESLKNKLEFLFDHPYNAVNLTTEETASEKERKEESSVVAERDTYSYSEIVVEWEQNEDMTEEGISECAEGHVSRSAHNLTLGSCCEQEHVLSCVSAFQHKRDDPLTLTAFPFNGRMLGGVDTFKRIQLSRDSDEDGLNTSPLLTRLPGQLHEHEEVPREEEKETSGCHTENSTMGFSGIYSMCNEVHNCISPAVEDIAPVRPERPANCEKTNNSPECFEEDLTTQSVTSSGPSNSEGPGSDADDSLKFEKKELFDKVLTELNLFFGISISDFTRDSGASSSEQCVHVTEALDRVGKEDLSIQKLGCCRDPSPDDEQEDSSLEMCAGDPEVSPACESEQEVPLGSHLCTKDTQKEPPQRTRWSPSFLSPPLLEQRGYTGADEAAGASANMQPANPGRTLKESQDQTTAPPGPPGNGEGRTRGCALVKACCAAL
ncbi:uncharacterized protein AB9W97_003298 isoform 2-T2 [Spinachia spinachia]